MFLELEVSPSLRRGDPAPRHDRAVVVRGKKRGGGSRRKRTNGASSSIFIEEEKRDRDREERELKEGLWVGGCVPDF